LIFYFISSIFGQIQLGNDIYGSDSSQDFGFDVEISNNGNRFIAQSFKGDVVRAYKFADNEWNQLGEDFTEFVSNNADYRGNCSISGNGEYISIGYPNSGKVVVYFWNATAATWEQVGPDIDNSQFFFSIGYNVDLSDDGNRILVNVEEEILIYDFDSTEWGLTLSIPNESFGNAVLSDNGEFIAIGDQNYAFNNEFAVGMVVTLDISNPTAQIYGDTIFGEDSGDRFGENLEISSDGKFLISSSAYNSSNADISGFVKVFNYDGNEWILHGNKIEGDGGNQLLGWSVDISNDGNTIAVGNNTLQGEGGILVYRLVEGNWVTIGEEIIGVNSFEGFGTSLSISGDANTVIGGGPEGSYNMLASNGVIRVYSIEGLTTSLDNAVNSLISEFKLFPNPVISDILHFEYPLNQDMMLVDHSSRVRKLIKEGTESVDVSNLEKGLYFITDKHFKLAGRFVRL